MLAKLSVRLAYVVLIVLLLPALPMMPNQPQGLPQVYASTTLFSDNFDSYTAAPGTVTAWNNPSGSTNYEPPLLGSSGNIRSAYNPASSSQCTTNTNWSITVTPITGGSLASKPYYLLLIEYVTSNGSWEANPSEELAVTLSGSNNAILLSYSYPTGNQMGISTTISQIRIYLGTSPGGENTYFVPSPATGTLLTLTTLAGGVKSTPTLCDPWPPTPYQLAKNAIFVTTTERAHGGTKSLLMGGSDIGYDKTSTNVQLISSAITFPSNSYLTWSAWVWLSNGTPYNAGLRAQSSYIMFVPINGRMRYFGNDGGCAGAWWFQNGPGTSTSKVGCYLISTQAWHQIQLEYDISVAGGLFHALIVDGVDVTRTVSGFSSIIAKPAFMTPDAGGFWRFAFWINNGGFPNRSRATIANNGIYVFIDDISISVSAKPASLITLPSFVATPSTMLCPILRLEQKERGCLSPSTEK